MKPGTLKNYGWDGSEIVAFRLHLPSKILFHNARDIETDETAQATRGNILAWEQHLADRLDGRPVEIHVEMESQSILYRTLWLFAGAFLAAVIVLALLIWWTMGRGRDQDASGRWPASVDCATRPRCAAQVTLRSPLPAGQRPRQGAIHVGRHHPGQRHAAVLHDDVDRRARHRGVSIEGGVAVDRARNAPSQLVVLDRHRQDLISFRTSCTPGPPPDPPAISSLLKGIVTLP